MRSEERMDVKGGVMIQDGVELTAEGEDRAITLGAPFGTYSKVQSLRRRNALARRQYDL